MGTTTHRPAACDPCTYIVQVWRGDSFMAAVRRVEYETPLLFGDAVALAHYFEAEAHLPDPATLAHERRPMSRYLLIESRDPYETGDARGYATLAGQLKAAGHEVTLFLVQNGVLPVRAEARCPALRDAIGARVEVLADEFSLRERGIAATQLLNGVQAAPISLVVDRLAAGWKTLWH